MKTRGWLVAAILSILASYSCMSQCGTPQTISYDTTVIGTGSNEDDPFIFTFPMFNGGTGTLSSVN
ncbi:MAG: hypothetical protein J7497_15860, partial [Chitinophagaceae bacterium]|nr:hypothetical protein [Chitinophagaceae bacterium]